MRSQISGAFAALVTPIDTAGYADIPALERLIDFLLERGIDGVVIGGATGEYPHFDEEQRLQIAAGAIRHIDGRAIVMTSVGASSIYSTLRLARCAADSGNDALLLPMPYFFRYEQQDLGAFCEEVCRSVPASFLLYNLPVFTNPITVNTALTLLRGIPNLIGMKDSSGVRTNLTELASSRDDGEFSLLVGDDSLLLSAARAGWDGVISGIACFAPELIAAVYRAHVAGQDEEAAALQAMVDEIIQRLVKLPTPWAVRVGLAARGIPNGAMHLPLSSGRARQIDEFRHWFEGWAQKNGLPLAGVWSFQHIHQ